MSCRKSVLVRSLSFLAEGATGQDLSATLRGLDLRSIGPAWGGDRGESWERRESFDEGAFRQFR